jgi:hypothetical protein
MGKKISESNEQERRAKAGGQAEEMRRLSEAGIFGKPPEEGES